MESERPRLVATICLSMLLNALGCGAPVELQTSTPIRQTFSPPQFVSLFNDRIAERVGVDKYWGDLTATCSNRVEYERFRLEEEATGPPYWASRDSFANDEAGMRAWHASPLGVRRRQAIDAFQRAQMAYADCFSTSPALTWRLHVYAEPSTSAKSLGVIHGHMTPGRRISFTYDPGNGLPIQPFPLDDYAESYYLPRYEHSVLEQRGDWFLLPRRPFASPAWVNLKDIDDEPQIGLPEFFSFRRAVTGTTFATGRSSIVPADTSFTIVERRPGAWVIREETTADRACPPGGDDPHDPEAPPNVPPTRPTQLIIDLRTLVDLDMHLIINETLGDVCD